MTRAKMIAFVPLPPDGVPTVVSFVSSCEEESGAVVDSGASGSVVSSAVVCSGICSPTRTNLPLSEQVKETESPSAAGVYIPSLES